MGQRRPPRPPRPLRQSLRQTRSIARLASLNSKTARPARRPSRRPARAFLDLTRVPAAILENTCSFSISARTQSKLVTLQYRFWLLCRQRARHRKSFTNCQKLLSRRELPTLCHPCRTRRNLLIRDGTCLFRPICGYLGYTARSVRWAMTPACTQASVTSSPISVLL